MFLSAKNEQGYNTGVSVDKGKGHLSEASAGCGGATAMLTVENAEPFMRSSGTSSLSSSSLLHLIFANKHFDYFYYYKSRVIMKVVSTFLVSLRKYLKIILIFRE